MGTFTGDGKIINDNPAVVLLNQYKSVFSTPSMKHVVNDSDSFFSQFVLCINEVTHICSEDNDNILIGIPELVISDDSIIKAINNLTQNSS